MLSAAATYAPKNVRINCVAPGLTRTPLSARITGNPTALKVRHMGLMGSAGRGETGRGRCGGTGLASFQVWEGFQRAAMYGAK
eukprot:32425-Chlamydomonas_euryale.AAC.1